MRFASHATEKNMADDLELDLDDAPKEEHIIDKRIKSLSEKVRLTSEERDEFKKLGEEKDAKLAETQRERDFYSGFADVVVANPSAKDYKEDILTKVKGGYSVEDATFAVLGKAGKLGQPPPPPKENPAGGSAVTPPIPGQKILKEMSRDEKRTQLLELEARGDISIT